MRKSILCFLCLFVVSGLGAVSKKDLSKVAFLLEKVDNFYKRNPKLKGNFTLIQGGNDRRGYFLYQHPSRLKLFFGPEKAEDPERFSFIMADKNNVYIYLPHRKVLVEQEVPEYFQQIGMLGMGISRFFANYQDVDVQEEEKNGEKLSIVSLSNPIKNIPYTQLTFTITEEGFISGMRGVTVKNNQPQAVSFLRYNLVKNVEIDEKEFQVKPQGDIQILRNVLIKTKR